MLVREPSQDRRENQLHHGIGREQQPDGARAGIKSRALGIERQDRNDDAEADQIDEYCREDDDEWRAFHESVDKISKFNEGLR